MKDNTCMPHRSLTILTAFILCLALAAGCSAFRIIGHETGQAWEELWGPGDQLGKKVLLAPVINVSAVGGEGTSDVFGLMLTDYIKARADRRIMLTQAAGLAENVAGQVQVPTGLDNTLDILAEARERGINVIVGGFLADASAGPARVGIWPFSHDEQQYKASFHVWAYETSTGAKILDKTVHARILDQGVLEIETGIMDEVPPRLMEELVADTGFAVMDTVQRLRWRGFVTETSETGRLIISSGREVGLVVGDRLSIHDQGRIITGPGGSEYVIPGPPIGPGKIVAVHDGWAEIEPTSEADYTNAAWVELAR